MKSQPQQLTQSLFIIEGSNASDWVDRQVIMQLFPISKRALQNLRSKKLIPYATLGGKIFYYLPGVIKALEASARRQSVIN